VSVRDDSVVQGEHFSVVHNESRVAEQSVTLDFRTVCPIPKQPFQGTIKVTLNDPHKFVLEYITFAEWVNSLKDEELSHEEVARAIFEAVKSAVYPGPAFPITDPPKVVVEVWVESVTHPEAYVRVDR